jgi:hypothetical protein
MVKTVKKSLMIDYAFSNITFEPPNHVFTHAPRVVKGLKIFNIIGIVVKSITNYYQEKLNIDIMWKCFTILL